MREKSPFLLILVPLLLAGCTAVIPDLSPFAKATGELRTAVKTGFDASADTLSEAAAVTTGDVSDDYTKFAEGFAEAAKLRGKVLTAFVEYTDRLVAIADAGVTEQEKVKAATDNVNKLVDVVGNIAAPVPAASPAAGLAHLLADAVGAAAQHMAQQRTAAKLDQALTQAQPAVEQLVAALDADLQSVADSLKTRDAALITGIEAQYAAKQTRDLRAGLRATRRDLAVKLQQSAAANDPDGDGPQLGPYDPALLDKFLANEKVLAAADAALTPVDTKTLNVRETVATCKRLVLTAAEALSEWGDAHAELAAAVREGRRPSLQGLTDLVVELKDYHDRLEKLRSGTK